MAQMSMQSIAQCLVVFGLITLCTCYPGGSIDSQELTDNPASISDLEKYYTPYRVPSYFNLDDENPMQRLQYQLRLGRRALLPSIGGGQRGAEYYQWPNMRQMISMMTKRVPSPRYRQCYFNPVACFRK